MTKPKKPPRISSPAEIANRVRLAAIRAYNKRKAQERIAREREQERRRWAIFPEWAFPGLPGRDRLPSHWKGATWNTPI